MPFLRWFSFHLALLACALLGAALVVAPALLVLLAALPDGSVARADRLLVLQVGSWLVALLVARFYSRRTGSWPLARWRAPLPAAPAASLATGHAALLFALWQWYALKRGEGSGLLFLLALAVIAIGYLPALSRLAEGRPAEGGSR
jgi:hypothetical protein